MSQLSEENTAVIAQKSLDEFFKMTHTQKITGCFTEINL